MIYPDVPLSDWLKKHNISSDPIPCLKCQSLRLLDKPIAFKDYRGAELEDCTNCGYAGGFRVVPIGTKLKFWEQFRPEEK